MATSFYRSENQYQIEHLHQHVYTILENMVKIGLAVSEISLLQAIVKKEERKNIGKKVTAALHKPARRDG